MGILVARAQHDPAGHIIYARESLVLIGALAIAPYLPPGRMTLSGSANVMGQRRARAARLTRDQEIRRAELAPQIIAACKAHENVHAACERLGIGIGSFYRIKDEALNSLRHEGTEDLRQELDAQHVAMIAAYWDAAIGGDTDAEHVVHKHLLARAKLNGANVVQPIKLAGADGGPIEVTEVTADELFARIRRLAGDHAAGAVSEAPTGAVTH